MEEPSANPNERDAGGGRATGPGPRGPTTVLVIDGVRVFRERVATLLAADPRLRPAGEAGDGDEGLRRLRELRPQAVVLDALLPGMEAAAFLAALAGDLRSEVKVVVLCPGSERMVPSGPELHAAIRMKPDSAHCKNELGDGRLTEELVALAAGSRDTRGKRLLRTLIGEGVGRNPLSPSELDVLRCAADDMTTQGIAFELGRSASTVANQRQAVHHKLGVHSTPAAVRKAQELGLLPDPRRPPRT